MWCNREYITWKYLFDYFDSTSPDVHVDFSQNLVYDQYDDELNHEVVLKSDDEFNSYFEHTLDIFDTCQNERYDSLIESTYSQPLYDNYEENELKDEMKLITSTLSFYHLLLIITITDSIAYKMIMIWIHIFQNISLIMRKT